jgi:superfamily II DNA/RNA helicase
VNYECPDDEKTYVHRIGRTGRAGREGVAVTFVDWRDMHRWKLINDALSLGMADPEETYSTSEHLYTELDIPRAATGTLPRAMRERAGLEAEAIEDIGETGRIRTPRRASSGRGSGGSGGRGGRNRKSTGDATSQAASTAGRRRRRTRAGREIDTVESAGQGQAAPEQASGQASEQAPRLRRRRRTSARSGNQSEETRRKAS